MALCLIVALTPESLALCAHLFEELILNLLFEVLLSIWLEVPLYAIVAMMAWSGRSVRHDV
jgi:hypothetical protein